MDHACFTSFCVLGSLVRLGGVKSQATGTCLDLALTCLFDNPLLSPLGIAIAFPAVLSSAEQLIFAHARDRARGAIAAASPQQNAKKKPKKKRRKRSSQILISTSFASIDHLHHTPLLLRTENPTYPNQHHRKHNITRCLCLCLIKESCDARRG